MPKPRTRKPTPRRAVDPAADARRRRRAELRTILKGEREIAALTRRVIAARNRSNDALVNFATWVNSRQSGAMDASAPERSS